MYLTERLIGVAIYSLSVVIFCLLLTFSKSAKGIKKVLITYSVLLSVMAFFYVPHENADLFRIFGYIEAFSKYSFEGFLRVQASTQNSLGLAGIFYWLISKTGVPNLLPAIVSFICYNCVFYIFYKTAKKNNVSGKNTAFVLFFYMSFGTYIFVVSGIRCMLSISLLMLCFYRESMVKKVSLWHIPIYAIAALMHAFAAVLLAARFVLPIFDTKMSAPRKIAYVLLLGIGGILVLNYFGDYILSIVEKADSYITGSYYSYIWDYVVGAIAYLLLFSVLRKSKRYGSDSVLKYNVFRYYFITCLLVSLAFCYEFSIFHRTVVYVLPMISVPFLMAIMQGMDDIVSARAGSIVRSKIANTSINYKFVIVSVSLIILVLSCIRGSLCSLKFFVW